MPAPLSTSVSSTEKVLIKPIVEHFDEHADMCAINSRLCAFKRCFQAIETKFNMFFGT
jgi:hypothetical protein